MTTASLIIRFSETTLKGRNRRSFENRAAENVRKHLEALGPMNMVHHGARMIVMGRPNFEDAGELLKGLPGVANFSIGRCYDRDLEALGAGCLEFMAELLRDRNQPCSVPIQFRVSVERKDKRYPLSSMDIAGRLGALLITRHPALQVNLDNPEVTLFVEIWEDRAVVYENKLAGGGGLAVGSSGRALCLLSGGFDSPVAAYRMMTRGVRVIYLHFHSYPFIGEQSKEKVLDLVGFLSRYQPRSRLLVAQFAQAQTAIRDHCPAELRTVLYRRLMNRVANQVARREKALAIVTGESVGQVASQTLENIHVINEVAEPPVLQPLIGMSKQQIIDEAKALGTYAISVQPFPDCCTLFQPKHPHTRASPRAVHRAEERLPLDDLVRHCIDTLEIHDHGPEFYPVHWS